MTIFDKHYDRKNTQSAKWDLLKEVYSITDDTNIIPMWVADMDFAAPEAVTKALQERLEFPLFGYTFTDDRVNAVVTNWLARRTDWRVPNDAVLYHQGVVPAIASVVEAFSEEGDAIIVNSPIYPPFFKVPEDLGRRVVYSPFIENDGQYTFDFENFELQLKNERPKTFIFCHPHNPAGIIWTEEILQKIDDLCFKYNVLVLSDEIHSDLILTGEKHIPFAKASAHPDNVITCVAPTKTFNIAGIQAAMIIVTDSKKRLQLQKTLQRQHQMGLNTFAITALEAAFSDAGEAWLNELIPYLNTNINYVKETIEAAIPAIHVAKPSATYLVWIDYRATNFTEKNIMKKLLDAGVAVDPGTKYGAAFDGFLRMNIACTKETLEEATARFIKAFS